MKKVYKNEKEYFQIGDCIRRFYVLTGVVVDILESKHPLKVQIVNSTDDNMPRGRITQFKTTEIIKISKILPL